MWRSFQLDPSAPRQATESVAEYLGHKYGGGVDAGREIIARVSEVEQPAEGGPAPQGAMSDPVPHVAPMPPGRSGRGRLEAAQRRATSAPPESRFDLEDPL